MEPWPLLQLSAQLQIAPEGSRTVLALSKLMVGLCPFIQVRRERGSGRVSSFSKLLHPISIRQGVQHVRSILECCISAGGRFAGCRPCVVGVKLALMHAAFT